jgi:hypothetical protein
VGRGKEAVAFFVMDRYEQACLTVQEETFKALEGDKRRLAAVKRSFRYKPKWVKNSRDRLDRVGRVHAWAIHQLGRPIRYNQEAEHIVDLVKRGRAWHGYILWSPGGNIAVRCKRCKQLLFNCFVEAMHEAGDCSY